MNVSLFEMSAGLLLSTDPNSTAQLEELVHTYNTAGSVPEKVSTPVLEAVLSLFVCCSQARTGPADEPTAKRQKVSQ